MKFKDYYKVLDVEKSAAADDIQKAYRKLARKFHPDVNKDSDAEDRFKEISEAYEVLSDPERRQKYDAIGNGFRAGQDFQPPPEWAQQAHHGFQSQGATFEFDGFSDFFGSLFGQQAGNFHWQGEQPPFGESQGPIQNQPSEEAEIEIGVHEAVTGVSRTIGLATRSGEKTFKVKIPPLVVPGSRIRLAGQGSSKGDLFLRIKVVASTNLKAKGSDLTMTLPISPWEAALGEKIEVTFPDGSLKVAVPAGSQSGSRLRVRNRGLGKAGGGRGDAFLELQISLPKTLTERERELFEELKSVSQFSPRGK